jgi:cytochrome c
MPIFLKETKMSRIIGGALLALTMVSSVAVTTAWAAGNAANGATVFQSQCAMCHGSTPGAAGIGPSLAGIYDKPAASTAGYRFSSALTSAHLTWDDATLDKFIASPQAVVPGTKMPYAGLPNAGQRADVIAYLASLTK